MFIYIIHKYVEQLKTIYRFEHFKKCSMYVHVSSIRELFYWMLYIKAQISNIII